MKGRIRLPEIRPFFDSTYINELRGGSLAIAGKPLVMLSLLAHLPRFIR